MSAGMVMSDLKGFYFEGIHFFFPMERYSTWKWSLEGNRFFVFLVAF